MSKINWGSDLSYLVYKRTYARTKAKGTEEFSDTVDRILEACNRQLDCGFTEEEQSELRSYFYDMKGSVAGRFLWQLGTKTVNKLGLLSLQNCAGVVVNEPVRPFTWTMDALMLGCGVGFNLQREFVYELPKVKKAKITRKDTNDADFIVPDSREGWVQLLGKTLKAHFFGGKGFSYSTVCIRGQGTPIKGFGGTSSGPEVLCEGIDKISALLNKRAGKKVRPVDCLDIMNIIASIVVAGNVRRCLPFDSLVHTERGLVPICDVIPKEDKALTSSGYKLITNKFEQGFQNCIVIKTQDGVFECTPNHRMAVLNSEGYEWKQAQDLLPGDRLLSPRESITGRKTKLPDWSYDPPKHSTTCKNITIPELDSNMAWFIGLFQADGYTYPNFKGNGFNAYVNVVVGEHELDIAEKAKEQLQRFGDSLHITIKKRKNEKSYMVHCQSKQLAWYFAESIKQANTAIRVPSYIKEGTEEVRLAYIAGVADGDGALQNKPVIVTSTVYPEWAEELQKVLYSCGIESRVKHQENEWPSREGWQKISNLGLITLHSKQLFAAIPELIKTVKVNSKPVRSNGVPSEWISSGKIKDKYGLRQSKQMSFDSYEKEFGKQRYVPVEVIEIKEGSQQVMTYDIEVEDLHEFYCNGYLTHNSAEIGLGDYDDLQYLNAKDWSTGNIPNHRAMSNNSVVCSDINKLPDQFWEGYNGNGEPYGLINLKLSRKCGRLGDTQYADEDVMVYNPCAEQSLANYETCCLAELYLPNLKTLDEAKKVATFLYRINKHSLRLKCHHPETEEIVHKHMRMGIGVTGYLQATEEQRKFLPELYEHLRAYDKEYSAKMGWPESIKITTVKPSGTLSLLAGVTPGVHPGYAPYYIRRVRIQSDSPLIEACRKAGYHMEPQRNFDGSESRNTLVVSFPETFPEGTVFAKDVTAIDQLEYVKRLQTDWSDNSVSCTVYYKKEELPEIKEWLKKNYNDSVKTVSFLLHSDHGFDQAPLEEISKEQYEEMIKGITPITDVSLQETDMEISIECGSGGCPVK